MKERVCEDFDTSVSSFKRVLQFEVIGVPNLVWDHVFDYYAVNLYFYWLISVAAFD